MQELIILLYILNKIVRLYFILYLDCVYTYLYISTDNILRKLLFVL